MCVLNVKSVSSFQGSTATSEYLHNSAVTWALPSVFKFYLIIVEIFIKSVRPNIAYRLRIRIISTNTVDSDLYFRSEHSRRIAKKIPIFSLNSFVSKTPLVQSLIHYLFFMLHRRLLM